jgi:hypothetical protein
VAQAGAPTLSVIITVYNGEEDLPRTLDSLRAQTFDDFELLVVDNGSNDATWEIIQEVSWRRMRGHRLKERRHEVDAFTQALAWAQGQYVVHHGAGDVSEPGRFEQQIARMKRGRTLGAVGAYARWVDAEGGTLREIKPPSGHKAILKWLEREDAEFVLGIARGAAMLNREALEDVGGFRTALGHAAFLDIWLRLAASDYKLANVTTPLYTVQFNPAAPYIRFHAEARAFATLARDLTKGDGEKAAGAEGEKAGAPPDARKAEAEPPVDKGEEKPEDRTAAEKGESTERDGEDKPAEAKVDEKGKPPDEAKPAERKTAAEAKAAEQGKGGEAEGEAEVKKPGEEKPVEAAKSPEAAEKDKSAETKVDEEDKPPAEAKAEPESGEAPDEEKKDEGEKADEKAEKPAEAKSTGEDVKAEAGKPEAEGEPSAGKKSAEAGEKSEAGEAEGEKKGEDEEKEDEKPEEEEKPVEAGKAEESAREEKTDTAKAEAGKPEAEGEPSAGKKSVEAGEKSEAGEVEEDKKSEAGGKEDEKPEEKEPVEAGKATELTEKGLPEKSEGGGKGETPTAQKPAGAGETSEAGEPEEDKKGEAGDKEAGKPEKSGPVEVAEPVVPTEKMTPVERARRLAAERADRGLAARLRERSDNYLAWAGRFDEWGGAAGEHVRQMWTRALLAYPLNPAVWAFAYRRLADRTFGGGDQDDAGSEA